MIYSLTKRAFCLSIALIILSSIYITLLSSKPKVSAATVPLVSSSTSDPIRWMSLSGYRSQLSFVTWPQRSSGCAASGVTAYKSVPWLASYGSSQDGNSMNANGDCATRYSDGGWYSGAWLDPSRFSWATDGTHTLVSNVPTSTGFSSTAGCYAGADRIWAAQDNSEHAGGAGGLFQRNGYSTYSNINGYGLYSHGTIVTRKQFNISSTDYSDAASFTLRGVADDFMRVYINGSLIMSSDYTSTAQTFTISKSALRVGQNNIAIQAADKAVWSNGGPSTPPRGAGLCYTLTAETNPPPPPPPASPPTCSPVSQNRETNEDASFTAGSGDGTFTWSAPGSTTPTGFGSSFLTSYTTTGPKTVTVTSGGLTANCSVDVSAAPGRPYLRVYGGDVQVGTSFSQPCVAVPKVQAKILTFNLGSGSGYQGSGTQMAVFAAGTIDRFVSANGTGTLPPKSLTFANTSGAYGGEYGKSFCAPDYWAGASAIAASYNIPSTGYSIGDGTQQTIYVNGDATIEGNIIYTNSGSWANLAHIPSYTLVVRGNIYIGKNVTQLDGTYIALPTTATNGVIYTCTNGSTPFGGGGTYVASECNTTLTVNGSFIAREIKFLRTRGTLNSPDIAEIFRFGPEVWAR